MSTDLIEITEFAHYAPFLKARFELLKKKNPRFSHGYCAKKLKSNPSYLKHVLEGRKKIGLSRISSIASVFQLNDFEKQYFTFLVLRALVKDHGTSEYFTEILCRLSYEKNNRNHLAPTNAPDATSFPIADWLLLALIELTSFPEFVNDPKWIQARLIDGDELSTSHIAASLKILLDKGILKKSGDSLRLEMKTLVTADPYDGDNFKAYRGIVGKIWSALENPGKYRKNHFFEAIASVDEITEAKIFTLAKEFQDKVITLAQQVNSPSKLVLISSNLLNLAKD